MLNNNISNEDDLNVQEEKKSLSSKILSNREFNVCKIIKDFETSVYSIISNILVLLKDNDTIYHTYNYKFYNYDNNYQNIITDKIPIMILLGGMSYKMYSLFYNNYFKNDIIDLNDCLIDSIDYDFSVIVKPTFDKEKFKNIVNLLINKNGNEFYNINKHIKLEL